MGLLLAVTVVPTEAVASVHGQDAYGAETTCDKLRTLVAALQDFGRAQDVDAQAAARDAVFSAGAAVAYDAALPENNHHFDTNAELLAEAIVAPDVAAAAIWARELAGQCADLDIRVEASGLATLAPSRSLGSGGDTNEQIARIVCGGTPIFALPPHQLLAIKTALEPLAVVSDECTGVTVKGRLGKQVLPRASAEYPGMVLRDGRTVAEGDGSGPKVDIPGWFLVSTEGPFDPELSATPPVTGWVDLKSSCARHRGALELGLCEYFLYGAAMPRRTARRVISKLSKIPIAEIAPLAVDGLPDLVPDTGFVQTSPGVVGGPCIGNLLRLPENGVSVRNDGTATSPTTFAVSVTVGAPKKPTSDYRPAVIRVRLVRGLEPGEQTLISGSGLGGDVEVDPRGEVSESLETNNELQIAVGGGQPLVCR